MKLSNLFLSALLLSTLSFSVPASAETISATVSSGRTTPLSSYSLFAKGNCRAGPKPRVEFRQPKNGTLSVVWTTLKGPTAGGCASRSIKGYGIFYTPKPGFHGKDSGKIYFSYLKYGTSGNQIDTVTFNLTVK